MFTELALTRLEGLTEHRLDIYIHRLRSVLIILHGNSNTVDLHVSLPVLLHKNRLGLKAKFVFIGLDKLLLQLFQVLVNLLIQLHRATIVSFWQQL
jgi:hypothetical protein